MTSIELEKVALYIDATIIGENLGVEPALVHARMRGVMGGSAPPTERIAHLGAAKTAALRDFNPVYDRSGSEPAVTASQYW